MIILKVLGGILAFLLASVVLLLVVLGLTHGVHWVYLKVTEKERARQKKKEKFWDDLTT